MGLESDGGGSPHHDDFADGVGRGSYKLVRYAYIGGVLRVRVDLASAVPSRHPNAECTPIKSA